MRMIIQADQNPKYWREYTNLQKIKHELIRGYLNGWLPKMSLGANGCSRLLYIDTHAGRGKHLSGKLGSPLVALTTLLDHAARGSILQKTEVQFYFIERDEQNVAALKQELTAHTLPKNVAVDTFHGDCFQLVEEAVAAVEQEGKNVAPGFYFIDPYGFKVPGKLLRKLMKYPKVEVFLNVIWRELDMAIQQSLKGDPSQVPILTSIFDGDGWMKIDAEDSDDRAEQCADLFRKMTSAEWGTHIRMLDNNRIRYFLLHLTNHDAGRDLMKKCIWDASPDGGYYASKADGPDQQIFIESDSYLAPLRDWVKEKLRTAPKHWKELNEALREELWLSTHLNEVIRELKLQGSIEAVGKFAEKSNPLLRLNMRPVQGILFD